MLTDREGKELAQRAAALEEAGQIEASDRLRIILEQENLCLVCGTRVVFDEHFYRRTGLWKCPFCDA